MVFCGQYDIFGSRCSKDLRPLFGIKELCGEVWSKVLVCEAWRVVLLHEVDVRPRLRLLPIKPAKKKNSLVSLVTDEMLKVEDF